MRVRGNQIHLSIRSPWDSTDIKGKRNCNLSGSELVTETRFASHSLLLQPLWCGSKVIESLVKRILMISICTRTVRKAEQLLKNKEQSLQVLWSFSGLCTIHNNREVELRPCYKDQTALLFEAQLWKRWGKEILRFVTTLAHHRLKGYACYIHPSMALIRLQWRSYFCWSFSDGHRAKMTLAVNRGCPIG